MGGVTVGVTYKFKKRGWNAVPTVPMVPESQLNDMRDRVNALKGENESLKRDLVEARNKKPEVIVKKEGWICSTSCCCIQHRKEQYQQERIHEYRSYG